MNSRLEEVLVKDITTDNDNPRKITKPEPEFVASVKANGVKIPPIVTNGQHGKQAYKLVAGARRIEAAKLAGLEKITVMIIEGTEAEVYETTLLENAHRKSLSILEQVDAINTLFSLYGNKLEKVADKLNMTVPQVRRTLLVNKLIPDIRKAINNPESPFFSMGLDALGLIAGLPKDQQEDINGLDQFDLPLDAKTLRTLIVTKYRLDLKHAPWNVKDDALDGKIACDLCKKQSKNQQIQLFDEAETKLGICTDPNCWAEKIKAYLQNCISDQMKIDGKTLVIDRSRIFGETFHALVDSSKFKQSKNGKIPVMNVAADGRFVIEKYECTSTKATPDGKPKVKSLADKKEQLEGLRIGLVLKDLQAYLATPEADAFVLKEHTQDELAALSVVFRQGNISFEKHDKKVALLVDLVSGQEVKFRTSWEGKYEPGKLSAILWRITKNDIIGGFNCSNSGQASAHSELAQFIAKYAGFDWDASFKKACVTKPDPKSFNVTEKTEKAEKKPAKKADSKLKKGTAQGTETF